MATVIQMALLLAATSRPTLWALRWPLIFSGIAAAAYAAIFVVRASGTGLARRSRKAARSISPRRSASRRSSRPSRSRRRRSTSGSASAGWSWPPGSRFADAHAAAIGAAFVAAAGCIPPDAAVIPILAALSTNTITKATLAALSRDRAFALEVLPGLLLVIGAAWTAWAIF